MAHLIRQQDRFQYPTIARVDSSTGRHYKVPGFENVPSVTTILDRTKDKAKLQEWADRVGQKEADRIKNEAAYVGTRMHEVIECFLADEPLTLGQDWLALRGQHMAFSLINTYFQHLGVVYGSEVALHYEDRYAGTTDLVAEYRGKLAIVDFKQSIRSKRHEFITDYFHQLAAYACAHDWMFSTKIEFAAVLVAVQDGTAQEFTTAGREFEDYKAAWWERVKRMESAVTRQAASAVLGAVPPSR